MTTAPVVGLLAGYAVWIAVCDAIFAAAPVSSWAAVYVAVFTLLGLVCLIGAARTSPGMARAVLRWAPVLPSLSTAYLLLVFLT